MHPCLLQDTPPDELVVAVMKELLRRTGVAPEVRPCWPHQSVTVAPCALEELPSA